jgi:trimeric autotransporter adhesin
MMPKHSSRAPWGRRLTAMVAVSLLTLGACSDSDSGVGPSSIEVVEIVTLPNNQTLTNLVPGNTRQMLAAPTNSKGNFIDRPVTWASSNPAAATITDAGLVTAVAGGSTWIRATAGGKTDSIAVGVRYPVGTINITPATSTLRREGALQLTATTLDALGATVTGRPVTWSTSNAAVATVSTTGLVAAQASPVDGSTVTITATALNAADGGTVVTATRVITISGDAVVGTVTVTGGSGFRGSAGTIDLTATATSGLGNTIAAPITWSTNNPAIATVNSSGTVSFVGGVGSLTVTATAAGAGANGANVAGTTSFEVAAALAPGTVTAPDIPEGQWYDYAILGTGLTSFRVQTSGGTGDVDMYLYNPGVTSFSATNGGGSGWVCRPWAFGNNETCNVTTPLTGWYRVRMYAYNGDGTVAGLQVSFFSPIP